MHVSVISFFILFERCLLLSICQEKDEGNVSQKALRILASVVMRRSHQDVAVVKEEKQLHPSVNKFVSISVVFVSTLWVLCNNSCVLK